MQSRELQAPKASSVNEDPLIFLQSSSDEEVICQVQVSDKGSITQCVKLTVQGVPVCSIIDSVTDIMIGEKLFNEGSSGSQT